MQDSICKKSPNIVYRTIAQEAILVPIQNDAGDLSQIYALNAVAARVWELLDGERTLMQIAEMIHDEFEVEKETVIKDIKQLSEELLGLNIIQKM